MKFSFRFTVRHPTDRGLCLTKYSILFAVLRQPFPTEPAATASNERKANLAILGVFIHSEPKEYQNTCFYEEF
jgi:hypothetical protein